MFILNKIEENKKSNTLSKKYNISKKLCLALRNNNEAIEAYIELKKYSKKILNENIDILHNLNALNIKANRYGLYQLAYNLKSKNLNMDLLIDIFETANKKHTKQIIYEIIY